MRLLFFTEKSDHSKRLIHYALVPNGYEILLLHRDPWTQDEIKDYMENGVSKLAVSPDPVHWKCSKTKAGKLYSLYRDISQIVQSFQPDVINLQFVHALRAIAALFAAGWSRRLIISFWGSDLLRQNKWFCLRVIYPVVLCRANVITFDAMNMLDRMHQLYGKRYDHKFQVVRFCNPTIDRMRITQKKYTRSAMRLRFGIPQDGRIIVAVGYSQIPEHNHLKITQAIAELPEEMQRRMFLVYPMTYGDIELDYIDQIDVARSKLCCESLVLKQWLSEPELPFLYLSTDAFIHAQTTDAYSQTFVDYIYAGATVFQASWLHYPEIDRYGIKLYEFSDYLQLTKQLADYLNDFPNRCLKQDADTIEILYKTESPTEIAKKMKVIMEGE